METTNYLPVIGLLVLAVVVTILLLRVMRSRHAAHERRASEPRTEAAPSVPPPSKLSKEEQEYLDSSHISGPIIPGGHDALDTRADAWRNNKRK